MKKSEFDKAKQTLADAVELLGELQEKSPKNHPLLCAYNRADQAMEWLDKITVAPDPVQLLQFETDIDGKYGGQAT